MNENVKRILTKIHNASEQGSLSFFVGAGVSMLSGQPSWTDLLNKIKSINDEVVKQHYAKRNVPISKIIDSVIESKKNNITEDSIESKCSKRKIVDGNTSSKDNYAKAQILFDALELEHSENKFYDIVKFCFNENAEANDIHDKIVSLNPSSIITTNFDKLIEKACKRKAEKFVTVASDDEVSSIQGQRFILKIHGDFEHKNIVFTEDSYLNYERQFPLLSRMLTSILATNTVVFIGYSLSDFNIRLLVNLLKPLYQKIAKDKKCIKNSKFSANVDNDTRPIFYNVGGKRLSNEDKKYLLKKGIEALDCHELYKNVDPKNYKFQYTLLFSYLQSLDKIDTASLDKTHELYKSFLRYESFNAVTTDMLLETSSEYVTGIYNLNGIVFRVCFKNCSIYKRYLYQSIKISQQSKKECDFITKIFLKAGIRKILVDLSKKIVDLLDLIGNQEIHHKQSQIQQFYTDCISLDYKKLESYSKRKNIDYRLKNYALYKIEKYDELLKEIESNSDQLYGKRNKEIEFLLLKLNFDCVKKISVMPQRYPGIYHLCHIYKNTTFSNKNNKELSNVNESTSSDAKFVKKSAESMFDSKVNIHPIELNLNKISLSRLLKNLTIVISQKYTSLIDSPSFPIPNSNLRTIKKFYQRITRDIFTGDSIAYLDVREIVRSITEIQRYLIINGVIKDKDEYVRNIVIDIIITILPTFDLKKEQSSSNKTALIEFNNEIFYLMLDYCSSNWLLNCFRYRKITKLYCGKNNENLSLIEISINNLINYANRKLIENKVDGDDNSEIWYYTSITSQLSNLIVISSFLDLSLKTSFNIAKCIFNNFSALFYFCSEEIVLFFTSILNESHKDDGNLKLLLTKWIKDNLVEYMSDYQIYIKNSKYLSYKELIYLILSFLHKYSDVKWLDSIYLSPFKQKNSQLFNFASLRLSWYVSKEALAESLKIAHSILESNASIDIN